MTLPLSKLVAFHVAKHRPALTLEGFTPDYYGVTAREVRLIAAGKRRAPDRFLQRVAATHSRLLPNSPAVVALPDNRLVHIDEAGELSITFPKNPA